MSNPQLENGYTSIANELMEALASIRIPGEQMQCLLVILRKTYGWKKKRDHITMSQFAKATGIKRSNVSRALRGLRERKIISVIKSDNTLSVSYSINKKYEEWKVLSKKISVIKNDTNSLSKKTPTIYNLQKKYSSDIFSFCENFISWSIKEHGLQAPKKTNSLLEKSCEAIDRLIRIDGFTLEYIISVFRWAAKDDFWRIQVRSLAGVRKKTNGLTKFQNIAAKFESSKIHSIRKKQEETTGSIDSGVSPGFI